MKNPKNSMHLGFFENVRELFRVEVIASHKADSPLKAQDTDIAPSDIAVFAI